MAEEQSLNDDLESFADALRSLTPRPAQRDRLMFEIGQVTTQRRLSATQASLRLWKLATSISTLAALTFAGLWFANVMGQSQIDPPKVETVAHLSERIKPQAVSPQPQGNEFGTQNESPTGDFATSYIRQFNRALAEGIESIPLPRASGGRDSTVPRTYRDILESVLHSQELGG